MNRLTNIEAEQLYYLLKCMINRTIHEDEMDELQQLLQRPGAEEVLQLLPDAQIFDGPELMPPIVAEHLFNKIDFKIELKESIDSSRGGSLAILPKKNFNTARWLGLAACILAAAVIGFLVYQHMGARNTTLATATPVKQTDVAPGTNKAVLVLGDGSKIVLDSAQSGSLNGDAGTQLDKQGNRLAYKGSGNNTTTVLFNTLEVPRGGQYQLVLPDGTQVWLNSASSLRYPTAFTGDKREVDVKGEAYFEVAPSGGKSQPFFVNILAANGQSTGNKIAVLGTSFNVMAYDDEPAIATTLLQGKVNVQHGTEQQLLAPGQQAAINASGKLAIHKADTEEVIAWKNQEFSFHGAGITTIMRQVSRWYNVSVVYKGTVSNHFNGTISRDVPVSKLLHLLSLTGNVKFTIENNVITVEPA